MLDTFIRKNKAACISALITFLLIVTLLVLRGMVAKEIALVKESRDQLQTIASELSTQQVDLRNLADDLANEIDDNSNKTETILSLSDEIRELD